MFVLKYHLCVRFLDVCNWFDEIKDVGRPCGYRQNQRQEQHTLLLKLSYGNEKIDDDVLLRVRC